MRIKTIKLKPANYLLIVFFLGVIFFFTAARYYICPFKSITGIPCAGCGLTRGFKAILHLKFADALFKYNILSLPLFLAIAILFLISLLDSLTNKDYTGSYFKCLLLKFKNKNFKYSFITIVFITLIITWYFNIIRAL